VLDSIGLIPEQFGRGFWEDTLFCWRAKEAGFTLGIIDGLAKVAKHDHPHSTFHDAVFNINGLYEANRKIFMKEIGVK